MTAEEARIAGAKIRALGCTVSSNELGEGSGNWELWARIENRKTGISARRVVKDSSDEAVAEAVAGAKSDLAARNKNVRRRIAAEREIDNE